MWQKLIAAIKRGLIKIGLLKEIEKITDLKDISVNEEMFQKIEVWKSLYRGYYEPFHKVRYKTISGWKERTMQSLQMPKIVSSEMAALVFNEKCEISIDNETVKEFIDEVFERNSFNKEFQDHLEFMFAHGGAVIKPYVEEGKVKLSFVTADCFVPVSWNNGRIYEGVFVSEYRKGDKKYTHLEWHTWENGTYVVKNELYESNGHELGVEIPLSTLFPNLESEVRINGLKRPLFVYFKPNTANNIDTKSPLGISIYANALDTMKAIDTAFDSFHREFRLGKKRIFVPDSMVKVVYDQDGRPHRYFDPSDEVYQGYPGNMDETTIHDVKVE
ncbi:MAG: phage portal protein, partial [Bacillales bacterium]